MSFCHFLGGQEGKNRQFLLSKAFMMKKEEKREVGGSQGSRSNFTQLPMQTVTGDSTVSLPRN